jgi:hypothetical protein
LLPISLRFEAAHYRRKIIADPGALHKAAQHFRDTPSLGNAAAWGERRLSVKDLANRADAGIGEMRFKAVEKRRAIARSSG